MLRLTSFRVILIGVLLVLCGIILGTETQPSLAQTAEPAEYIGSKTCSGCHRALSRTHALTPHGLALQVNSKDQPVFKADFTKGEKERTVTFPGESSPRAFKPEDVAYVIGVGQHVERYVYKKDKTYLVFPAQWNTEKKVWEVYQRNGKDWSDTSAYDFIQNCAGCHTTGLDQETLKWKDIGVSCESCHGPGSNHADAVDKASDPPTQEQLTAIRGSIVLSADAQICGQCHSQGTEPDKKLSYPIKYQPGGTLLASDTFSLVPLTDTDHWWTTGHAKAPNMQYNEWTLSNHSKALENMKKDPTATAACLQCHSAEPTFNARVAAARIVTDKNANEPAPTAPLVEVKDAKFGVTCVSCHSTHTQSKFAFNLPQDPYTLCTSCHTSKPGQTMPHHPVQDMFEGKQVVSQVSPVASTHFTDTKGPKCQTCHMPIVPGDDGSRGSHTMKLVNIGANPQAVKDTCTACHTDITPDAMKKFITNNQQTTKDRLARINASLKPDSAAWMKTAVSFVEQDGSYGIHNHRYTEALLSAVETQLGLLTQDQPTGPLSRPITDPNECGSCHKDQYQQWLNSPHAKASINDVFRQQYALQKGPTFCMNCHASGYDKTTNQYKFEGVICSTCHYTENGVKHPPGPIKIANESQACGQCHSGAHAPVYDEWLVSKHSAAKVDCVDCHTPHNNGLKQGDVNKTCTNCHKEPLTDAVHMSAKMTCTDCHMKTQTAKDGVTLAKTGHAMIVDPSTCSTCHGNIHTLSIKDTGQAGPTPTAATKPEPTAVATTQDVAQSNLITGLAGGVIGTLIVVVAGLGLLRWRKLI